MFNKNTLAEFIATFFYIGKIKYCPGTFGSLAAFPLFYLILYLINFNRIHFSFFARFDPSEQVVLTIVLVSILVICMLFILGTYCTSIYIKHISREDPKEVVIDEVVGQMLAVILSSFSVIFVTYYSKLPDYISSGTINFIFLALMPFILFRLFDILKPWPINWLDQNIKGGIGVMLDDILAAIFAAVIHYAITFKIIDWYS